MSSLLHSALGLLSAQWPCLLCLRKPEGDDAWSHLDRRLRIASLGATFTLRDIIKTLRNTQAYNDTTGPQSICSSCVDSAVQSLLFWHLCEESEKKWAALTKDLCKITSALETQLKNRETSEGNDNPVYILNNECNQIVLSNKNVSVKNVCKYLNRIGNIKHLISEYNYDLSEHGADSDGYTEVTRKKTCKRKYKKSKSKTFSCTHCAQNFKQKHYLITHLKLKHSIFQRVECNNCGRKFNSISLLRRHVSAHRTADVYKCSSCEQIFYLASQLESHITEVHHEKKFQCPECPELFYRSSEAKKHQMAIHDSGHENVCKICGKKYQSLVRLLNHEERHKGIVCDKCGRQFSFPYKLKIHSEKCSANRTDNGSMEDEKRDYSTVDYVGYTCAMCNKNFSSAARLKHHLSCHMGVVCDRCGRPFKYRSQLKSHSNLCLKDRMPGNPRPYKLSKSPQFICDNCGQGFNFKDSLKAHIKSQHMFHNTYKCSYCEKKFSYKGGLKAHLLVHTKERSELCNICGKYFVTKPALVYHMRLHTGERPFACELCDEKFLSASRRMAHIRTKHWGRTEECSVCPSKFYTPYAMRKHMKRHFNPNSKLFCNKTVSDAYVEYNVE